MSGVQATVKDVPAQLLITEYAALLKKNGKVTTPHVFSVLACCCDSSVLSDQLESGGKMDVGGVLSCQFFIRTDCQRFQLPIQLAPHTRVIVVHPHLGEIVEVGTDFTHSPFLLVVTHLNDTYSSRSRSGWTS